MRKNKQKKGLKEFFRITKEKIVISLFFLALVYILTILNANRYQPNLIESIFKFILALPLFTYPLNLENLLFSWNHIRILFEIIYVYIASCFIITIIKKFTIKRFNQKRLIMVKDISIFLMYIFIFLVLMFFFLTYNRRPPITSCPNLHEKIYSANRSISNKEEAFQSLYDYFVAEGYDEYGTFNINDLRFKSNMAVTRQKNNVPAWILIKWYRDEQGYLEMVDLAIDKEGNLYEHAPCILY